MNRMLNMETLCQMSTVLASGLPEARLDELPADLAEVLIQAKANMNGLPAVIANMKDALRDCNTLELAIIRLQELAAEAAELPENDQAGRDEREREFIRLAGVVAQVAGERGFTGPRLTLKTRPEAQASRRILRYLGPLKDGLSGNLEETTRLVLVVIKETMNFLEALTQAYPETAHEHGISDLLSRTSWIVETLPVEIQAGMIPPGGLH
ncbi:MAG: hypothetical protein HQK55_09985 [Deltaproteobacteria bacterium]|nr:hypothetical protein [Deltaproteobacteria bacterium]